MKKLIINADDFGMSQVYNSEILQLLTDKMILSTTVMVNRITPSQSEQIEALKNIFANGGVSVGLHIEFSSNNWLHEVNSQYEKFKEIMSFPPTHIDIHKASDFPESYDTIANFCNQKDIPLRNMGKYFSNSKITKNEAFFGSLDSFSNIQDWLLQIEDGETREVLFHPGKFDPESKSSYNEQRSKDVEYIKTINDIKEKLNIEIISFLDM